MQLLKSQKNEIFDLIIKYDFSPSDFEIKYFDSSMLHFILKGSEFYFEYRSMSPKDVIIISPSYTLYEETFRTVSFEWNLIIKYMINWLEYLRREITQPDKWAEYERISKSLDVPLREWDNNKFDYAEVQLLKEQLSLLKKQIGQLGLPPEKENTLNISIDYLAIKVETSSKIDWKNLVVGAFISTFVQLALNPETINKIWNLVKPLLSNMSLLK